MSPVLPREERDAIRARVEGATPGPWWIESGPFVYAHVEGGRPNGEGIIEARYFGSPRPTADADAEFIAHARTDVPALLDALDAAEAEARDFFDEALRLKRKFIAARAEVAALRGRVVRMADSLDRLASNAPSTYAGIRHTIAGELRALAAAPSETEEGR